MRYRAFLILVVPAIVFVGGCRAEIEGTGPGKRHQDLALRPQDELEIGRQAFRQLLDGARVIDEGPEADTVRRVTQQIAKAVMIEPLRREINLNISGYRFEWQTALVEDGRVNALCLPGGKIVVFSGLLKLVHNDDELATVISHEIAHALAHHTSERIAREMAVGNRLLNLAFSREQESEADHIGVFLMTFAGYDPDEAIVFWSEMSDSRASHLHLPEILSDHPNDSHRLKNLQEWVTDAKAGKAAFDAGRIASP